MVDVVALLTAEDVEDGVLVGHSYGGSVITAVAERVPERLAHLAYVDAIVPFDGESNADSLRAVGGEATVDAIDADAGRRGDGRFGFAPLPAETWGLDDDDLEWVRPVGRSPAGVYLVSDLHGVLHRERLVLVDDRHGNVGPPSPGLAPWGMLRPGAEGEQCPVDHAGTIDLAPELSNQG